MTKTQVEVIIGAADAEIGREGRRSGSLRRPGAWRRFGSRPGGWDPYSQFFCWRQPLCERSQVPAAFFPVSINRSPRRRLCHP